MLGFNPSSLESYLERQLHRFFIYLGFQFQSFFSGKLFGKIDRILRERHFLRVSILLLWKVIWKAC